MTWRRSWRGPNERWLGERKGEYLNRESLGPTSHVNCQSQGNSLAARAIIVTPVIAVVIWTRINRTFGRIPFFQCIFAM
jgi:hypothetical protein